MNEEAEERNVMRTTRNTASFQIAPSVCAVAAGRVTSV